LKILAKLIFEFLRLIFKVIPKELHDHQSHTFDFLGFTHYWGNRNSQSSTVNRRKRFRGCIAYYRNKYEEGRAGFVLNWDEEKTAVLGLVKFYLPQELLYKQGKSIMTYVNLSCSTFPQ